MEKICVKIMKITKLINFHEQHKLQNFKGKKLIDKKSPKIEVDKCNKKDEILIKES
jgi:hypothetical protein